MNEKPEAKPMGKVIQIDEARIRVHLGEMVRGTVEEALNARHRRQPRRAGACSTAPACGSTRRRWASSSPRSR